MIELSPFLPCTGAHAFRWTNKRDSDILHGRLPFEFRLIESTTADFDIMVESGWDKRWRKEGDQPLFWQIYETPESRATYEREFQKRKYVVSQVKSVVSHHAPVVSILAGILSVLTTLELLGYLSNLTAIVSVLIISTLRFKLVYLLFRLLFPDRKHVLFVYGTLKKDMHWNQKFLSNSTFLHSATTLDRFPLVVGRCGVPYLLGGDEVKGEGKYIHGEVWLVDDETLENLDEYEGLGKGYYQRKHTRASLSRYMWPGAVLSAQVYVLAAAPLSLRTQEQLEEYTLKIHQDLYRAVEHILLKQQMYLAGYPKYSSTDLHPPVSIELDGESKR